MESNEHGHFGSKASNSRVIREDSDLCAELSTEDRLLIQMSRLTLAPKVLKLVNQMLQKKVDWSVFTNGVISHRLSGFVHHHCQRYKLRLPSEITQQMAERAESNKKNADFVFCELDRISRALENIGFPVLVMKGPVLSHQVYVSRSIRPFFDIDLLAPFTHLSKIEKHLYGLGYVYTKRDFNNDRIVELEASELNQPPTMTLHQPVLWKKTGTGKFERPTIDLHISNLRLGKLDFDNILERSCAEPAFAPGLRVPSPQDQVVLLAYHFYNHYRLPPLADVSFTRGALPRQTGALKFLADLYASIIVNLTNASDWSTMLNRSEEIGAKEFLTFGLFYLDYVYGIGTVPKDVMDKLLNQESIQVPIMGNASVSVDSIGQLLDAEIETSSVTIGPAQWMFHPHKVPMMLVGAFRKWKSQGNDSQIARCFRVDELSTTSTPDGAEWELADELSLDETKVNPMQFFRTHVTGGVWPSKGGVRASMRVLWNDQCLFLKAIVCADRFYYVRPEDIAFGEGVNIYIANLKEGVTHKIGLTIGKGGEFAPEPQAVLERSYRIVELAPLKIWVSTFSKSYRIQVSVPWSVLNLVPQPRLQLGFDVEFIHRSSEMTLETAIAWAGGRFMSEGYPEIFGELILDE